MVVTDIQKFFSFGIVSTSSTTVGARLTMNLADTSSAVLVQGLSFQALEGNTGPVYVCNTSSPTLTGTMIGVLWEVLAPSVSPATRPFLAVGNPTAPDPLNAAELYILPTVSGEGLRVAGIQ